MLQNIEVISFFAS